MTQSLETQAQSLRSRIAALQDRLDDVNQRLHRKRVAETGLVGRRARSDRVPHGIEIKDITFHTWSPGQPQSVTGPRANGIPATIHLSSPGFQIDDPDRPCLQS